MPSFRHYNEMDVAAVDHVHLREVMVLHCPASRIGAASIIHVYIGLVHVRSFLGDNIQLHIHHL